MKGGVPREAGRFKLQPLNHGLGYNFPPSQHFDNRCNTSGLRVVGGWINRELRDSLLGSFHPPRAC